MKIEDVVNVGDLIELLTERGRPDEPIYYTFEADSSQRPMTFFTSTRRELLERLKSRDPVQLVSCVTATRVDVAEEQRDQFPDYEQSVWIIGHDVGGVRIYGPDGPERP